jgi:hypothetical protein
MGMTKYPGGLGFLQQRSAADGAGLSPQIWSDCPILGMMADPGAGILARDDFMVAQATGFPYELSGTNGTFAAVASAPGTALLNCPGADNDEAHIAYNNDVAGLITCNASKKWWYEARVKLSQIAAEGGVFVGLLDEAASADDIMANATMALTATIDCLGFQIVNAAAPLTYWRTMMQLAARAAVSETAIAVSTSYIKLGMKSVPNADATVATITFYSNGVPLANTTTTAATDYPLDQVLIPHFGIKTGSAAAFGLTIDWWQAAQLR